MYNMIKYLICTNSTSLSRQAVKTPKTCNSYMRPMMWATRGCTECSGRRLGRSPSQRGLLLFHVNWLHFWKVDISMCIYIYVLYQSIYIYIKILYNTTVWFVYYTIFIHRHIYIWFIYSLLIISKYIDYIVYSFYLNSISYYMGLSENRVYPQL